MGSVRSAGLVSEQVRRLVLRPASPFSYTRVAEDRLQSAWVPPTLRWSCPLRSEQVFSAWTRDSLSLTLPS